MKRLIRLIFVVVFGTIGYGMYLKSQDIENGERFIGLGVLGMTFVLMPIFLVHRYKNKSLSDYKMPPNLFSDVFENKQAKKK
jgi:hypothetical protein